MADNKKAGDNKEATPSVIPKAPRPVDYDSINSAQLRPRYRSKMEQYKRSLKDSTFKSRKIVLPNQNLTVDYSEIDKFPAYAIKKFNLAHMFELTDEQLEFINKTPLNFFARKRVEAFMS